VVAVASVIAWSDRRARLALILAALGVPSFGVTLPAAAWLGTGSVRQRRLSSGGEPATGFIALVFVGLGAMMLNAVLQKTFQELGAERTFLGVAGIAVLAVLSFVCAASILRIHPERRAALFTVRAGLAGAAAGGAAVFVRLIAAFD
jgi:hypothetical protein